MIWSYDTTENHPCCGTFRPNDKATAGILTFGMGTRPEPNTMGQDAFHIAASTVLSRIQKAIAQIWEVERCQDYRFVTALITETLGGLNETLRNYGKLLSQGVYVGGVILYIHDNTLICVSFGGGCLYLHRGVRLERLNPWPQDNLIRNALGASKDPKPDVLQTELHPGDELYCVPDLLPEGPELQEVFSQRSEQEHPVTSAMLLRQYLSRNSKRPCAVLKFQNYGFGGTGT